MADLRTETHSRLRGQILHMLARHHPNFVDVVTVQGALDSLGYPVPMDDLKSYLSALEEVQAIRTQVKQFGRMKTRQVAATFKGINIVDGREPCPAGILLDRE